MKITLSAIENNRFSTIQCLCELTGNTATCVMQFHLKCSNSGQITAPSIGIPVQELGNFSVKPVCVCGMGENTCLQLLNYKTWREFGTLSTFFRTLRFQKLQIYVCHIPFGCSLQENPLGSNFVSLTRQTPFWFGKFTR